MRRSLRELILRVNDETNTRIFDPLTFGRSILSGRAFNPKHKSWSSGPGQKQMALPERIELEYWRVGVVEYWKNDSD